MSLGEVFPAVCEAEKAVSLNANWWVGHQTLGRAQLGLGEVKLVGLMLIMLEHVVHFFCRVINVWKFICCSFTSLIAF